MIGHVEPRGNLPAAPPPDATPKSARAITWARRRRSMAGSWRTFRKSKIGMAGLVMLFFFILVAIFAPFLAPKSGLDESYAAAHHQPQLLEPSWMITSSYAQNYGKSHSPNDAAHAAALTKQVENVGFLQYPFGTDAAGRSVYALTVWGSRVSLYVGLAATIMTIFVGAVVGIASGFYGGKTDTLLNAVTNWFLVIPWIALAIVLASILGPSLTNIILVIAITSWAGTARIVRSQALTVRNRAYVERGRALGASNWHLVTRHILPNVFPIIWANTTLTVALSILAETTLSLLGLGSPTDISWGSIIEEAFKNGATTLGAWWWLLFPGLAITLVVLAFAMCSYALDEILDPRLRDR